MPTESIWTALPTGRGRGTLTLAVHVAPRLTSPGGSDGTLDDHDAFVRWPPPDLSFEVVVGPTTYPATAVAIISSPNPDLWEALFPPSSTVKSHTPTDWSQTPIHTYPLTKVASFLKDRYSAVAIDSPEQFPTIAGLLSAGFRRISHVGRTNNERWNAAQAELAGVLATNKVVDTRAPSTPTFDFVALEDFFASLDGDDPAVATEYQREIEAPGLDFHDAVQLVNQHPLLTRLLGLVFDLVVDTTAAPPTVGPLDVRVIPSARALDGTTVRNPTTKGLVATDGFVARPRPGTNHLVPGWLRLEDPTEYEVVSVDADGGGLKAARFACNLSRTELHPTEDVPTDAGLPTLRHDGFSVARKGAGQELHDKLVDNASKEGQLAANALQLYLDDLVRGVRVDVWDSQSARWHSLMDRQGSYVLAGGSTVIDARDEGFLGATTSKKPLADDVYATEEVFWWDGWSLAVPRPGKVLTTEAAVNPLIERPPNPAGPDFDAEIRYDVVAGTLPRLRHGLDYRFRARVVDLAGNSVGPDVADDSHATAAVRFGRFEPPQTPPVVLRHPVGPGESVETVVLRSNVNPPVPSIVQRHLVPPKVGQMTVELAGLIDHPDPDPAMYGPLSTLDAAMVQELYDVDTVVPNWAPDPALRQVALKLLDGPHAGHLSLVPMGDESTWPAYTATRLVVGQGAGAPSFNAGVLSVPLAKAEIVHARLSAVIGTAELDKFALWQWILDALPPGPAGITKRDELLALIATGQHWMFEPYRILTLVHAVRQPLAAPEFPGGLTPPRDPETTFTDITGVLAFHRKSTGRVDVLASWEEPVDRGTGTDPPAAIGEPGWRIVERQTAFTFDLEYAGPAPLTFRKRHELGDTKHRTITYRAVATTRFAEYFTTSAQLVWGAPGTIVVLDTGQPAQGVVEGSVKLTSPLPGGGTIVPVEGRHFEVDAATGTITFGTGEAGEVPAVGAALTAVYLVPPVTRNTSEPPSSPGLGPQVVSVPSSARPQAPKVRYVIPTFGWEDAEMTVNGDVVGHTSTRLGNGVRIYMDRPWWSSGDGELLGVVLWPLAELANPTDLEQANDPSKDADIRRPYVSQWGQDPIYGSRLLPTRYPRLASFPDAVATDTGLTLGELDSSTARPVNVAGHAVGYDKGRSLWYCDVTIESGVAYSPLVRLALARWQPSSILHAELSRVVLADVVQLAPDRFATVVFDEQDESVVGVTLTGPTHTRTEASMGVNDPGSARVIIEKKRTDLTGALAWQQVGLPIQLTAALVNGIGTWSGEVHLPSAHIPGRYRLILEQFELLGAEPMKKGPPALPVRTTPIPTNRLVHTDVIPI